MSLNKPRPDYPIYPSTGYFRERAKVFKRPKGRRGRKTKGQRVGRSVSHLKEQDPNFLIIKAQDEARKARELAVAQAKEQEELRKLQIADIEDERVERRRKERARQDELQIRRDEFALSAAQQRQQLRLQGEAREDTERYRAQKIQLLQTKVAPLRAGGDREQLRRQSDREPDRRPGEREEQQDVILLGDKVRREPEPEPQGGLDLDIPDEEGFGAGHRTRGAEKRKKPKRFEGGATEEELAVAGAIEGRTPKPKREVGGGSGSEETQRRGAGAGKVETLEEESPLPKLKTGEVKVGKQGGKAPTAKKFGSSPAGKAFAEEVKKSEEALRKAKERAGN